MAMTGDRHNDTPVQPQSERAKTVVGNGTVAREPRKGETPVVLIAVSRLVD